MSTRYSKKSVGEVNKLCRHTLRAKDRARTGKQAAPGSRTQPRHDVAFLVPFPHVSGKSPRGNTRHRHFSTSNTETAEAHDPFILEDSIKTSEQQPGRKDLKCYCILFFNFLPVSNRSADIRIHFYYREEKQMYLSLSLAGN